MKYIPIHQVVLDNAWRHLRNSARYATAGNFEYADGSALKATRNFRDAIDLNILGDRAFTEISRVQGNVNRNTMIYGNENRTPTQFVGFDHLR